MTDQLSATTPSDLDAPVAEGVPARPIRADAKRNYERVLAAGVGVGTLYQHFPKRIDVVEAVYREDVDELVRSAEQFVSELDPWQALVAWLEAFVRYASSKRTFLSELHEAFEKNPELRVASRERIEGAIGVVFDRAQAAGQAREDLSAADVMQLLGSMCMSATLTSEQSARLLVVIEDGLRPPQ